MKEKLKVYTVVVRADAVTCYDIEAHSGQEAERLFLGMEEYGILCPYQDLQESFFWEVDHFKEASHPRNPIPYEESVKYLAS